MEGSNSPSFSYLQAGQMQIPQHLLVCHVLQPPTTSAALLWALSSLFLPFLHWGQRLDTAIFQHSFIKSNSHPPQPGGHGPAHTGQRAISLHCCESTVLTPIQHCFLITIYFYSCNSHTLRIRGWKKVSDVGGHQTSLGQYYNINKKLML